MLSHISVSVSITTMKVLSLLVLFCSAVSSENILGFFPFGARSHFVVFNELMKALAGRGHSVVVVSPFEENGPIPNYESIDVKNQKTEKVANLTFDESYHNPKFMIDFSFFLFEAESNGNLLKSQVFQRLISRNISFDLIIFEMFTDNVFLTFSKKQWNVPMIGFTSCYPFPFVFEHFGVYENPSYMPSYYGGFSREMNFYERLLNTWFQLQMVYFFKFRQEPRTEEIFKNISEEYKFSKTRVSRDVSLLFSHSHFSLLRSVPLPPQVVEVGGIHIQPLKPVPQVILIFPYGCVNKNCLTNSFCLAREIR